MTVDYKAALHRHRFDLAFTENGLTGLIETVAEPHCLLIVNVAVAPSFQGHGLGRRLLSEVESLARTAGLERMRLYTNARFEENIRLYARIGYAFDGMEDVGVGVVVHMSNPTPTAVPNAKAAERG